MRTIRLTDREHHLLCHVLRSMISAGHLGEPTAALLLKVKFAPRSDDPKPRRGRPRKGIPLP